MFQKESKLNREEVIENVKFKLFKKLTTNRYKKRKEKKEMTKKVRRFLSVTVIVVILENFSVTTILAGTFAYVPINVEVVHIDENSEMGSSTELPAETKGIPYHSRQLSHSYRIMKEETM